MRKTASVIFAALAALILLAGILFAAVRSTAGNVSYFEKQFMELGVGDTTGVNVSDLSKSVQVLLDYMTGKGVSLSSSVMLNGVKTEMFPLSAEKTHMEEIRALYGNLSSLRGTAFLAAVLLLLAAFLVHVKDCARSLIKGYLAAFVVLMTVIVFMAIWSGINYSSFSTFLHRVLFPNSDAWMLPEESRLKMMFPSAMEKALLLRCGLFTMIPALLAAVAAVAWLSRLDRKEAENKAETARPEEEEIPPEPSVGEPDLVFAHKLQNMSVSRRRQLEQLMRERDELEQRAAQLKEDKEPASVTDGDDLLKVTFAPYEPSEEAEENDDDEDDDDQEEE